MEHGHATDKRFSDFQEPHFQASSEKESQPESVERGKIIIIF